MQSLREIFENGEGTFYGWIDPDGIIHFCKWAEHEDTAEDICANILHVDPILGGDELDRRGWIHWSYDNLGYNKDIRPTQAQLDTIFDITLYSDMDEFASESLREYLAELSERMGRV